MKRDVARLYRALGHTEIVVAEDRDEVVPEMAVIETVVAEEPIITNPESTIIIVTPDPAEPPLLDAPEIEALRMQFEQDPQAVLQWYRQYWDPELTEDDVREALSQAEMAFRMPDLAANALEAQLEFSNSQSLPDDFTFPGMDLDEICINPGTKKFETKGDALNWLLFSGPQWLAGGLITKAPFRWHNQPSYSSRFVYEMAEPTPEKPIDIALFSDFGTGLYTSRYIAKQLQIRQFPYAIHLGDVYYAGRRSEFRDNFECILDPILDHTELFTMNANHEMLSGAFAYFEYMDRRNRRHQAKQRQEGTYFCLRGDQFQIVGIDAAYFTHGRYREAGLLEWLEMQLTEGRDNKRVNIFLSSDQPYEYGRLAQTALLREDLRRIVLDRKLVDLWFWGNTHYCALFDKTAELPFIGSCIGHGGYPYSRIRPNQPSITPPLFIETSPRFPEWTGLRQDRGNNGYCILSLKADGTLALAFIDWMSNTRFRAELAWSEANGLEVNATTIGS